MLLVSYRIVSGEIIIIKNSPLIQTICHLRSIVEATKRTGPFLVIVPLSTCENWNREFAKWAPDLQTLLFYGMQEERDFIKKYEWNLHDLGPCSESTIKFDVVITSYEITIGEEALLKTLHWESIVIDEGHRLKSGNSQLQRSMDKFRTNSKVLLTGTPIQNTMEELWFLLNYLDPIEFDSLQEFLDNFQNVNQKDSMMTLHKLLGERMLRRTKNDVFKDMAGKTEQIIQVSLTPIQKQLYKAILTKNYMKLNVKNGVANSTGANVLVDLRKICNHPYLFSKQDLDAKLAEDGSYDVDAAVEVSGKLKIMVQMLGELKRTGNRVLIFTQFIKVLDILEDVLSFNGWSHRRLDGDTKMKDRQEFIDDYNKQDSEVFAFLISTKAGSLGINLATSDTVIFYDHDFNPHNDIQALCRSHRIGQKRHVLIYRLVCKNSVEEKMIDRQKEKMMLSHIVVEGGKNKQNSVQNFWKNELDEILKFGAEKLFCTDGKQDEEIVYSDADIKKILDREAAEKIYNQTKKDKAGQDGKILNNYMNEFKVATFNVRKKTKEELEMEEALLRQVSKK